MVDKKRNKINIIFIGGKAGAGKDTVATYLCNAKHFTTFSYANRLKEVLVYAGWDNNKNLRGRKLLQNVGKAFRQYDENFWVNILIDKIIDYYAITSKKDEKVTNICISDVRHLNEINGIIDKLSSRNIYIKNSDITGLFLYINRNNNNSREMDKETEHDISETSINFDTKIEKRIKKININNTGDIFDLRKEIDKSVFKYL